MLLSVHVVLILLVCCCNRRKVANKRFKEETVGLTESMAWEYGNMPSDSNLAAEDNHYQEEGFNSYNVAKRFAANDQTEKDEEDPTYYNVSHAMQENGDPEHNSCDADEKCLKATVATGDESASGVQGEGNEVEDTVFLNSDAMREYERLVNM